MLLACLADDFAGATELAGLLGQAGMRTVQTIGIPRGPLPETDALVMSLALRAEPGAKAVERALAAVHWLQTKNVRQIFYSYSNTFDSTADGNIGMVIDALMATLGANFTIACPAEPASGVTVFRGHLFVGDQLLSDSAMAHHARRPMPEANLVRVLQPQTRRSVALVHFETVARGPAQLSARFAALRSAGVGIAIVDALSQADLVSLGAACAGLPLVTGSAALAVALAANFRAQGLLGPAAQARRELPRTPIAAILSGSCTRAAHAQSTHWAGSGPTWRIDPLMLAAGEPVVQRALEWAQTRVADEPVLITSASAPWVLASIRERLGEQAAGALVGRALADIACGLETLGVRHLVVAGGETALTVLAALGVDQLTLGPQIEPGLSWMVADRVGRPTLALALKLGDSGGIDCFAQACRLVSSRSPAPA